MIAALFIFGRNGDLLISKIFREGVRRTVSEVFRIQVISKLSDIKSPVLTLGSTSFLHIRHGSLWLVAVTRDNADASQVLEFLYQLVSLLKTLILTSGATDASTDRYLTETDIQNNFIIIYEILDRLINFGYIQNWNVAQLQSSLHSPVTKGEGVKISTSERSAGKTRALSLGSLPKGSLRKDPAKVLRRKSSAFLSRAGTIARRGVSSSGSQESLAHRAVLNSTSALGAKLGIKSRKSQLHLHITEKISLLMSHEGTVVRAFAEGAINVNAHALGDTSDCSFNLVKHRESGRGRYSRSGSSADLPNGEMSETSSQFAYDSFNNSLGKLTDCNFHKCVNLQDFDQEGLIRFSPPDGEFELMRYRTDIASLPLVVDAKLEMAGSDQMHAKVTLKSHFPKDFCATGVSIVVPTPPSAISTDMYADEGKAKYLANHGCIEWKIKKLWGHKIYSLGATVNLSSLGADHNDIILWTKTRPPVSVNFQISGYSSSGYRITNLSVGQRAPTVKSVTYSTVDKSYEIRI